MSIRGHDVNPDQRRAKGRQPVGSKPVRLRPSKCFPVCASKQTEGVYDGVDAPPTASMWQSGDVDHHLREASVSEVSPTIGLDIAKHVFYAHGAVDLSGRDCRRFDL